MVCFLDDRHGNASTAGQITRNFQYTGQTGQTRQTGQTEQTGKIRTHIIIFKIKHKKIKKIPKR